MNPDRFSPLPKLIFLAIGWLGLAAPLSAAEEKPNFLFIFADDHSFDSVGGLGNSEVATPHIDSLIDSGTTFTRCYNQGGWNGAVCIASRTMLLTGRYLWQAQREEATLNEDYLQKNRLWPQLLATAGYETYFSGKWHIKTDANKAYRTCRHVRPGMPNQTKAGYDRPHEGKEDPWSPWDPKFEGFWKGGKHWSEVLADDGEDYLEMAAESDKPFFIHLAFNAPHDPRQAPKSYVDRYPLDKVAVPPSYVPLHPLEIGCNRIRDEKLAPFPRTEYAVKVNRQEYYAIITHMDDQIGRILDALKKSGKADNTYIIFSADHGLSVGSHGLLGKQNMYDHSVRVPWVITGPGIPKGKKLNNPIYLQDVLPTTLELAGIPVPQSVQFKSTVGQIRKGESSPYPSIYGAYIDFQRMIQKGDLKLIVYPKIKKTLLFNLKEDPLEMKALSGPEHAETRKALFADLLKLQKTTADRLDLTAAFPDLM
ncbi:MAG: sulfatase-like hydrolase/transferase [Verrucomicrobiota bacterium]